MPADDRQIVDDVDVQNVDGIGDPVVAHGFDPEALRGMHRFGDDMKIGRDMALWRELKTGTDGGLLPVARSITWICTTFEWQDS